MKARIAVLGGDGIGPEVTAEAVRVLQAVAARHGHEFEFVEALVGGAAIDASGSPLPPRTHRRLPHQRRGAARRRRRPASGPTRRRACGPSRACSSCAASSACSPTCVRCAPSPACSTPRRCRPEVVRGVDIMVVRELTGGIYFGRKSRTAHEAEDVCSYTATEIERVTRVAGRLARAVAGTSCRWTRRTCSRPRACGAPWSSG